MAPTIAQQRQLMVLLSACFICATDFAHGASEPFLSLPEPSLVNAFLLANASDWTNPALGEQTRAVPLQVIKCASLAAGPSYDLYQVQVPGYGCEAPPPRIFNVSHQSAAVWDNKKLALIDFISLTLWNSIVAFLAFIMGLFCLAFVGDAVREEASTSRKKSSSLELAENSSRSQNEAGTACISEADRGNVDQQCEEERRRRLMPVRTCRIAWIIFVAIPVIIALLAAHATPRAIRCTIRDTWYTLVGPVGLPDPSQGLNDFLASGPDGQNLALRLCQTSSLNFYVGHFDTSCEQLGEPYGGLSPAGESGWQVPVGQPKSSFCVNLSVSFVESMLILGTVLLITTMYLVWVISGWLIERFAGAPDEETRKRAAMMFSGLTSDAANEETSVEVEW